VKKLLVVICLVMCLMSCTAKKSTNLESKQLGLDQDMVVDPVEALSMDGLVGKWQLLNSEGGADASGDHLLIARKGSEYKVILVYQSSVRQCTLNTDDGNYYVIAETGEKYQIGRVRSINKNENNSIGLDLIVGKGFENIDLGLFQRDDILKKNTDK
jgi:hypothetical protein